eukprot:6384378-Pyramimonas_sp.AAC.1
MSRALKTDMPSVTRSAGIAQHHSSFSPRAPRRRRKRGPRAISRDAKRSACSPRLRRMLRAIRSRMRICKHRLRDRITAPSK